MWGQEKKRCCSKAVVVAVLLGGFAGAVVALLFAPKAGRQLRDELCKKGADMADKSQEILQEVSDHANCLAERAKQISKRAKEAASSWSKLFDSED